MTNPNPTCPDCGSKRLTLTVTQLVDVTFHDDDHTISDGPRGDIEWTNDTAAVCDCGWCGKLGEAQAKGPYYAVTGRMCGDNEDHVRFYSNCDGKEAIARFVSDVCAEEGVTPEEYMKMLQAGEGVFVSQVLTSATPIEVSA